MVILCNRRSNSRKAKENKQKKIRIKWKLIKKSDAQDGDDTSHIINRKRAKAEKFEPTFSGTYQYKYNAAEGNAAAPSPGFRQWQAFG